MHLGGSESFICSAHPVAQDIVLNMVSLDYDDTLQAAAGEQAEQIRKNLMAKHSGEYLLAVEGNAPTRDDGVYCMVGGDSFLNILKETAAHAKAIVAWGSALPTAACRRPIPIPPVPNRFRKSCPAAPSSTFPAARPLPR